MNIDNFVIQKLDEFVEVVKVLFTFIGLMLKTIFHLLVISIYVISYTIIAVINIPVLLLVLITKFISHNTKFLKWVKYEQHKKANRRRGKRN